MLPIASLYKNACLAELEAIKPGNVHVMSDGHGMTVEQFVISAEVSAAVIAEPQLTLGQRIHKAVEATYRAVGCNTNLGIILLCAPLVQAALRSGKLLPSLQWVLANTTIEDARHGFNAITLANPAGLGELSEYDVNKPAQCNLLAAMQAAANRDSVARQYANGYADLLNGVQQLQQLNMRWDRQGWATTGVYLYYLAEFPDSHVFRKYGQSSADALQQEAQVHYKALVTSENPKLYLSNLLAWDADLKARGINPGTSADLTVATLLLSSLL